MGLALKAFATALAPLLASGFCQATDLGDWSATPEDAISSGRVEVKASAGELDVSAQKGSPEKLAADFKRFPSSDDWELKFKLKAASGLDEACACVVNAKGEALLRAGLTPVPFMDSVEGGKAQRLWTGKRTSSKGAAQAFKLLKLGNIVSLSIDGEDQSFAAIPAEGAKRLRIEFASSGRAPASLKIEELAAEAIVPASVKPEPLVGKIPKYAIANSIGWFPVDYRSPG